MRLPRPPDDDLLTVVPERPVEDVAQALPSLF